MQLFYIFDNCMCTDIIKHIVIASLIIVGDDYTTLTGDRNITAVFERGSDSTSVKILIHHDTKDEGEENFIAYLLLDSGNLSTTIIIRDTVTILCSFDKAVYDVYESLGNVTLTVNSSMATSSSNYTVQVNTLFSEFGNATGELYNMV